LGRKKERGDHSLLLGTSRLNTHFRRRKQATRGGENVGTPNMGSI